MSSITSKAYSVTDESQGGDLYAVVRGGQLKKQTRTALTNHVKAQTLSQLRDGGITANRPDAPELFQMYFDTDLNKPIWYNGAFWVDAMGATV